MVRVSCSAPPAVVWPRRRCYGRRAMARLPWLAVSGAFEFPVGHFAFDHAGVAPAAAGDEVAQDFTDGSTHCPGQP